MRERHPIDEVFRRGLSAAEVEPPAAVWEGVVRQRSERRRKLFAWRRKRWAVLLAVPAVGAALWWALGTSPGGTTDGQGPSPTGPTATSTLPPPRPAIDRTTPLDVAPSTVPTRPQAGPGSAAQATTPTATLPVSPGMARESTAATRVRAGSTAAQEAAPGPTAKVPGAEQRGTLGIPSGSTWNGTVMLKERLDDLDPQRMDRRRCTYARALSAAGPQAGTAPTGYLLPHGEWWLAVVAAGHDRTRRWQGSDPELVHARSTLEDHAAEWHFGLWAGRRWRSGFWMGLGLEHAGGRAMKEHLEHDRLLSTQVNTTIVVFDNEVLSTLSDTVQSVQERTGTTAITGRSSTWRSPLLLGWERSVRRWAFGAHVGLAVEWQRMRDGYLFREEVSESGLVLHRTERVRDSDRSFGLLAAQLGLDAGFQLTEHWRITAGPVFHSGLGVVAGQGAVQALPTRWGGQVRLCVDLSGRPR